MCGIYGLVEPGRRIEPGDLSGPRDALAHRGPDDAGLWIAPGGEAGLAHRRLSIIDLSAAGHQPMATPDGRLCIVFNGEIYNFPSLRDELEGLGHRFAGHSDTEVLLAAYRQWGEGCLERLDGMFAFAIHDAGDGRDAPSLFFARDRAGEKPFYYSAAPGHFEFASELKALTRRGGLDAQALNHYLSLGYVPGTLCIAAGVRKLPAAHAGRLDLRTLRHQTWRYWSLPSNRADPGADGPALADEAWRMLSDSVRRRLVSDVPLGVLLSGGLDSSLVVAAASGQSARPVKTFTIALPGSALDETRHAERVARHFATEHHVLELSESGLAVLDEIAPFVDEPLGDSSLLPAFLVSRLTRREVTVALGGDGGDELFGGYGDYLASLADQRRLAGVPAPLLAAAAALAARLPAGVRGRNRIASLRGGPLQQMIWGRPYFDVALRRGLLGKEMLAALGGALDAPERGLLALFDTGAGAVDRMTRAHFGSILPDDFLVKVDRSSMAVGLEMRAPYLDHRLIEFCFGRIPDHWKVAGGEARRVQRLLAQRRLPADFELDRKQGFSIPLDAWLRRAGRDWMRARLEGLPACIRRDRLEGLIAGQMAGRANGARLFALLMLALAARNLGL